MMAALAAFEMPAAGPWPLWLWSASFAAALLCAVWHARGFPGQSPDPDSRLDGRVMYWASLVALAVGLFGSRAMFVLVHGEPWAVASLWEGGRSFYGGLIAGMLAGALVLKLSGGSPLAYADAVCPAVALGYAIGRLGCLVNGDNHGTPASLPWAIRYPPGTEAHADHLARGWVQDGNWSLAVHPAQLYSSLAGFAVFAILVAMRRSGPGARFSVAAIAYGVGRFSMEYVRGDFRAVLGPLSLPQCLSLLLILTGAGVALGRRRRAIPANGARTCTRAA